MSKWWHVLTSVAIAAITVAIPAAKSLIAAHPELSMILASIWAIVGQVLPSPTASTK